MIFYWRDGVVYTSKNEDCVLDEMNLDEAGIFAASVDAVVRRWR